MSVSLKDLKQRVGKGSTSGAAAFLGNIKDKENVPEPVNETNKDTKPVEKEMNEPITAAESNPVSAEKKSSSASRSHKESGRKNSSSAEKDPAAAKSPNVSNKKEDSDPATRQESRTRSSVSDAELGARLSDHGEKELRNIRKGFLLSKKAVANLTHLSDISDRKPNDMINYLLENIFDLIK